MINFGRSLDMKVTVEGVENEWQVRLLQLIGCDLLQGYALGAPMSLEDVVAFQMRVVVDGREPDPEAAKQFAMSLAG